MKLEFNEEQRQLQASVHTWLAKEYPHQVWREIAHGPDGWSPRVWAQFAEMGWLAAALPSEHGGLDGGAMESAVLAEAFGTALVLEPYLSTVVLGAGLIRAAGNAAQQAEYLSGIAQGRLKLAFAQAESQSRFDLVDVRTRAEKSAGGWVISGEKISVWDAPGADLLLVLARSAGDRCDAGGLGLFVVPRNDPGVQMNSFPMIDRRPGAHVRFTGAKIVAALGDPEDALPSVELAVDQALASIACEACGAMQAALDQTVSYLRERKQFGQALAEFQVLRHRAVDMRVQLEFSRSTALHAAMSATRSDPTLPQAAAAAKVQTGRAGKWIGHQAIQLHGGMGMTDELAIGHYMKRLLMLDTFLGNADHHQQRFARLTAPQISGLAPTAHPLRTREQPK